jgi:hypothetical protein
MTAEEVKPFVRHWVDVYMDDDPRASYRGLFLSDDGGTFMVRIGEKFHADAIPTPERASLKVSAIGRIVLLEDPAWLVEANKAGAVIAAQSLLD